MSAIRQLVPVIAIAAALSACGKSEPPGPVSALSKAPEFAKCEWRTTKGASFSIQAFACGPDMRNQHIVADDNLPGFVLVSDGDGGPTRSTAIRLFGKPPTSPIAFVLNSVRAVSPGPLTRTCAFEPAPKVDPAKKRFVLTPVGEAKAQWEKDIAGNAPSMAEPCGPLGVGIAGDRYFFEAPGHPETVVFADMGSEIQIFDPETLTSTAKP